MPAQKRLHVQPCRLTWSKVVLSFTNLVLAPCPHQKKREPANNFVRGALEGRHSGGPGEPQRRRAVEELGRSCGRAARGLPRLAQCTAAARPAPPSCSPAASAALSAARSEPPKENKPGDSGRQMQISPKEPSYVWSASDRQIAFKFLTAEPTCLLFGFRRPERYDRVSHVHTGVMAIDLSLVRL